MNQNNNINLETLMMMMFMSMNQPYYINNNVTWQQAQSIVNASNNNEALRMQVCAYPSGIKDRDNATIKNMHTKKRYQEESQRQKQEKKDNLIQRAGVLSICVFLIIISIIIAIAMILSTAVGTITILGAISGTLWLAGSIAAVVFLFMIKLKKEHKYLM